MPSPSPQLPLRVSASHPWRWEEHRTVLVWEDGTTLSFLDELDSISRHTTQGRLPSLPCVALILAGCRGKSPTFNPVNAHGIPLGTLMAAADVLCKLQTFPPELLTVAGKAAIIEMVADSQRMITYFVADAVSDWREDADAEFSEGAAEPLPRLLLRISEALVNITPAAVRARMKTGLDDVPKEASLPDLELITSVRELISQFKEDAELQGIAALARDVLAALTFPRRPDEDAELPEGGFSDLTNRGSPDRLLLSELAAEPLLLAVRVSLNEALYLRRETPRRSKPRTVAVLVDTSLRMWGLPRPFAWAVALALLAKQEGAARLALWCVDGANVSSLPLSTRDDMIAALGRLDPGADPVPALRKFFETASTMPPQDGEANSDIDYFFVTHPDTLTEHGFWREADNWPPLHLALVDHEGQFSLEQRSRSSRRELARARLKLDTILSAPAAKTARAGPRVPLILEQHPFPLRISARGRVVAACPAGEDAWCAITEPRQWVRWKSGWSGGDLLAHRLPKGRVVWLDFAPPDTAYALFWDDRLGATLLRSTDGEVTPFKLDIDTLPLHAHRIGEALLTVQTTSLAAFSLVNGSRLDLHRDAFQLSTVVFSGRYFQNLFMWCTLLWDGTNVSCERLRWSDPILLAFDTPREGAHVLQRDGRLLNMTTEPPALVAHLKHPQTATEITQAIQTADGERLVLQFANNDIAGWSFSDKKLSIFSSWQKEFWLSKPRPPGSISFVNVTRIGFTAAYELILQLNGKSWYRLHTLSGLHMLWQPCSVQDSHLGVVPMEIPENAPGAWRGEASWPSGARILLDHHGLLHLMPVDTEEPEICLTTGSAGFWSSNGEIGGATNLLASGLPGTLSAARMVEMIAHFAVNALKGGSL